MRGVIVGATKLLGLSGFAEYSLIQAHCGFGFAQLISGVTFYT